MVFQECGIDRLRILRDELPDAFMRERNLDESTKGWIWNSHFTRSLSDASSIGDDSEARFLLLLRRISFVHLDCILRCKVNRSQELFSLFPFNFLFKNVVVVINVLFDIRPFVYPRLVI